MGQSAVFGTRIKLRRGREENYDPASIPLKGEVCLVDYDNGKLGAKVGDGVLTFAELKPQFIGVITGYYYEGAFYYDPNHFAPISIFYETIYIDKAKNSTYYYDGENFVRLDIVPVPEADEDTPGIMKLYNSSGVNTDGTMTQKSISDRLVDIDVDRDILTVDFGVYN